MLIRRVRPGLLVVMLVVTAFMSPSLAAFGQKTSPVAPARQQIQEVVTEAYNKFRSADIADRYPDRFLFSADRSRARQSGKISERLPTIRTVLETAEPGNEPQDQERQLRTVV